MQHLKRLYLASCTIMFLRLAHLDEKSRVQSVRTKGKRKLGDDGCLGHLMGMQAMEGLVQAQ